MTPNVNHTCSMNNHEKIPEWIDRFNHKDLHGSELKEFLELMKQEPELRREVKLDKELNELLADDDLLELRKKLIRFKLPKENHPMRLPIFILAASIVILIGLTIFAYTWIIREDDPVRTTDSFYYSGDSAIFRNEYLFDKEQIAYNSKSFDSIRNHQKLEEMIKNNEILLSENYQPYPAYESMVGEVNRAVNFKLLKPSLSDTLTRGDLLTFKWDTIASSHLTITISDNKGNPRFISQPLTEKEFHFNTSKLSKGLYYVKFINKNEIVYFSKFILY
jgi:hypothetical protein